MEQLPILHYRRMVLSTPLCCASWTEMTVILHQTILWTDSMTVLEGFQSGSCLFKVFVGTHVSKIQKLSGHWDTSQRISQILTPSLRTGRRDAALPQAVYAPPVMGRQRWGHCQNLTDQFWLHLTWNYMPHLQTQQK